MDNNYLRPVYRFIGKEREIVGVEIGSLKRDIRRAFIKETGLKSGRQWKKEYKRINRNVK